MSSRYDRINTAITQIPVSSAVKVFTFIDELFENKLNKEFFKKNFWNFNTGEQHFVCFYLDIYLNSSKITSFFTNWLQQKEYSYGDANVSNEFDDYKEELLLNKQELITILDSYKKTAQRRFQMLLKNKISFDQHSRYFSNDHIDFKIQLIYKPSDFKLFFIEVMKKIMTEKDALTFFYNSFEFGTNLHETKLLHIELNNLTDIKKQIDTIKERYDKDYKYVLENNLKPHNLKIEKLLTSRKILSGKQKEFYPKIELQSPTLSDFAKIMYNAFPEVRDKAIGKDITVFLKTYGSNLLDRK